MNQHSAATSSFTVTCPGCGQRLRFSIGADTPVRLRIQCSSCSASFAVRRPGADLDQTNASLAGATPPTLTGIPVPSSPSMGPSGPPPRRAADEPSFAPGERIAGRYRVVRFLARGGMGEVYEVEDLELRERVALKTVRSEVARDGTAVERFRREIQLARKVTHPNVCRIFDVSFHRAESGDQVIFLTMELLPGETLAQRLRRTGPLPAEEALPDRPPDGRGARTPPTRRESSTATSSPATSCWPSRGATTPGRGDRLRPRPPGSRRRHSAGAHPDGRSRRGGHPRLPGARAGRGQGDHRRGRHLRARASSSTRC